MASSEENIKLHAWAETLFLGLYRMIQTVKIHKDNNQLVKSCLANFKQIVSRVGEEQDLTILISEGQFYIQGEKVRYRKNLVRLINALVEFFERREIGGLRFHPGVRKATLGEILAFVRLLIHCSKQKDSAIWLSQKVEGDRFSWVTIVSQEEVTRRDVDPDLRNKAQNAYANAISSLKQVAQKVQLQGYAGVRKAKRVVQNMVDVVVEDEGILLGLGTIKDYDDYTYNHSVNVAVLSLCLGNRIGLSRLSLENLGICGLFHDLGKVDVPREIINKPGDLSPVEWEVIQQHPLSSVRQILNLQASHDLKSEILLAPFEHHIKMDMSGYPKVHFKRNLSLFGRILHIADVYDAITSPRVYRPNVMSPDRALSCMLEGAGKDFDPILLKVFAAMIGTYPVGTLVKLNTGEMGLVMDYPIHSGGTLPRVILLETDEGGGLRRSEVVDLSDKDPETGNHLREVIRSLNAASLGIQPAEFLLSETA